MSLISKSLKRLYQAFTFPLYTLSYILYILLYTLYTFIYRDYIKHLPSLFIYFFIYTVLHANKIVDIWKLLIIDVLHMTNEEGMTI